MKIAKLGVSVSTLALLVCGVAAQAQDASQAEDAPQAEEVTVTGSRILTNAQSPTPLTVVNTEDLTLAAPTSVIEGLIRLPALNRSNTPRSPASGAQNTNSAISSINLRNLGAGRTLVLVDGHRIVPADVRGFGDISTIPSAFISRIEVVTGGASAAYGSDAVAGAVNLVLNKRFEGVSGSAQGGISTYGDGRSYEIELSGGAPFAQGRGHVMASISMRNQAEINSEMARPWGRNRRGLVPVAGAPLNRRLPGVGSPATLGGVILTGPLANTQFLSGGVPAPFQPGTVPVTTAIAIVGSPDTSNTVGNIITGSHHVNSFLRMSYEVSDSFQPYVQMMASSGRQSYKGNMTFHYGPYAYTIFSGNPFIPAGIQSQMTGRGLTSFELARQDEDFGVPTGKSKIKLFDGVVGASGNIGTWAYDAYFEHGQHTYKLSHENNTNQDKLFAAADAVVDPATGRTVCRVSLTSPGLYPGCVPINLFGNGTPSPEALDYIRGTSPYQIRLKQQVASFSISGNLLSLPAGPLKAAFGLEYRKTSVEQTSDVDSQTVRNRFNAIRGYPSIIQGGLGLYVFTNVQPFAGAYDIKEGFAEFAVPVLRDVTLAKSLELNAAVRYADYSTSGGVTTWKIGSVYEPIDGIRFRGTVSRDIRAANLSELYSAATQSQVSVRDTITNGATVAYIGTTSGNPELNPERGLTSTFGAVLQPSWLPRSSLSVDYFNIDIKDAIQTLGSQQIVDQCRDGSALACNDIKRGSNGLIQGIVLKPLNFSSLLVRGVDIEAQYDLHAVGGDIKFRILATYLSQYKVTVPGGVPVQSAGIYTNPNWSASAQVTYKSGPATLSAFMRYMPKSTFSNSYVEGVSIDDNSVPARFYTDVTAQTNFAVQGVNMEAFLTVNNLFNQDPPIIDRTTYSYRVQTDPTVYDNMGRYFTVGIRFKF